MVAVTAGLNIQALFDLGVRGSAPNRAALQQLAACPPALARCSDGTARSVDPLEWRQKAHDMGAGRAARVTTCRTVILDSQNLRGAPTPVLHHLVSMGFRVHVSAIALEEVWAQAVREGKPGLLRTRIPTIAPFIDAAEPVKTAGVDLVRRLGGTVRGSLVPSSGDDGLAVAELWRRLVTNDLSEAFIADGARLVEDAAALRGVEWRNTNAAAAAVPGWSDPQVTEGEIARRVAQHFFETLGPQLSVPGGMHERFEGYYRSAGLHAARARGRALGRLPKVDENDAEDLQLLMHIGEGAFLATNDFNLVAHVDASGTFQAPWVRTLGELLTTTLPVGLPWGRTARRALAVHGARPRAQLRELEDGVRGARFRSEP